MKPRLNWASASPSAAFACSDVELLQWVESGGRLSYEFTGDGAIVRVQQALGYLRDLHQRRHRLSVPALILELLDGRLLVAGVTEKFEQTEGFPGNPHFPELHGYPSLIGCLKAMQASTSRVAVVSPEFPFAPLCSPKYAAMALLWTSVVRRETTPLMIRS